jgi:phosphoribosylaminoimidazole carboxylase / phosphoribosylaminoimidazole-succinocarboxamide synthase
MDARESKSTTGNALGQLLTEGKTKWVHQSSENADRVVVVSKDDITAGDGAKHDVIASKGELATKTTCNVFRLLIACDLPVAFVEQCGADSFIAPRCRMLPYEVVVRRAAHGSFLKRNPHVSKGQLFSQLLVEFYLKTKGRRWKQHELTCDDPLMTYAEGNQQIRLFHPATPHAEPFLTLPAAAVFAEDDEWKLFAEMRRVARHAFLVLEKAWQLEGQKLVDFKVEFGVDTQGRLLLADVIDNDSWRVIENDRYIDKQLYRDGGSLDDVAATYQRVAEITSQFRLPRQRIILWRGSENDQLDPFAAALGKLAHLMYPVTCSAHKEPVLAALRLQELLHEVADSVVVAYIGRSNGAGPTLSAMSTAPVITVPANAKEFPQDVWSSLRAPSNVPVMTVLEPSNAILAALQILSARNPLIYAELRAKLEARMLNTIHI